jgi:hypothetical protein
VSRGLRNAPLLPRVVGATGLLGIAPHPMPRTPALPMGYHVNTIRPGCGARPLVLDKQQGGSCSLGWAEARAIVHIAIV